MNFRLFYTGLIFSFISIFRDNGFLLTLLPILDKVKTDNHFSINQLLRNKHFFDFAFTSAQDSHVVASGKTFSNNNRKRIKNISEKPWKKILFFLSGISEPGGGFVADKKQNLQDKKLFKSIFMDKGFRDSQNAVCPTLLNVHRNYFRTKIWYTLHNRYFIILRI